jgi:hypothetical protein
MHADQQWQWSSCQQCGSHQATESVITHNGWIYDLCHACAVEACDPGYPTCAPSPVQL